MEPTSDYRRAAYCLKAPNKNLATPATIIVKEGTITASADFSIKIADLASAALRLKVAKLLKTQNHRHGELKYQIIFYFFYKVSALRW